MGLLKFALLCIDLLAWPVIALGYPLFASIRAIESGSKYHMKKLVIYWTLFSLFSLFEFAFVRIIEWIPFWSSVRLVVILWLVLPRFDGACHAYQGLVRPVLWGKVEAVINMFYKLKEKRLSKRETYLDAVEKYINENGPEALEKLIAMEHKSLKCIDSERDTNVIELHGNNAAMTSKQLNEPDAARVRFLDGLAKQLNEPDAATRVRGYDWFSEQVQNAQSISSASALNETDAATNFKEMTPPQASAETPPLKKTHQDWTCDLCKVTATTEIILNAHLQGRKHKSKLESLKASMLDAKDTGSSTLVQQHTQSVSAKGTYAAAEAKDIMPPNETAENRRPMTPPLKKAQQEWTCDLRKVTTTSEKTLNDHLHGSKHKSKLETLKASKLGTQDTGPSASATNKLNHGNVAEKLIKETGSELEKLIASEVQNAQSISSASALNETDAATNFKEMTPPQASAETPPLKKTHQDWTCDLCKVTATTEIILNAHLQGRKHKSKLESLKASMLDAKDTGSSTLVQQHTQSVSAKGTYAAAEAKDIMPSNETAENRRPVTPPLKKAQQEWTCDLRKVTTTSEKTLNDHLHGSKHKSKLETLKASKLGTQDTGPSASATNKLNHGNVAEKLIKETGSELEKLIASEEQIPNAEVEEMTPPEANTKNRCPETPPPKKTQQECSCGLCKITTTSEITLNDHLQGSKHKSKLESLKASMLDAKGPSPLETQQECSCGLCKITTMSEITLNDHLQGSKHKSKLESLKASMLDAKGPSPLIEVMTPQEASNEERHTKTPPLKKEWRCDVCKVTTTSEKTLNAHLKGSKHKAKFKSQKMSKDGKGSVKKSCKETKEKMQLQIFEEQWCNLCSLKLLSNANVASHYKGKKHNSNVAKMEKLEAVLSV